MGLDEAFRPIRNPEVLRGSSVERFAEIAGKVLAELNYVHPFREGNGRAQEALLAAIGREYGHDVDFTFITKATHDRSVDRDDQRSPQSSYETCI